MNLAIELVQRDVWSTPDKSNMPLDTTSLVYSVRQFNNYKLINKYNNNSSIKLGGREA